ncbi:hypothetical protein O9G_002428 [Rozella allomycis CSF55]|uniref:Uncharacterized protein n=1 Tax=Rozella allomycis (strain CSF55) TaxID=988480 RepID=A0A075AWW9_ROZAC|nr:hypothetical protein O9G_002428 [Rozella allomycis CSF55]|eukprot:EPZ34830.1 hypothetical protein O9G_002428 [Rozella allomycis CSF55]
MTFVYVDTVDFDIADVDYVNVNINVDFDCLDSIIVDGDVDDDSVVDTVVENAEDDTVDEDVEDVVDVDFAVDNVDEDWIGVVTVDDTVDPINKEDALENVVLLVEKSVNASVAEDAVDVDFTVDDVDDDWIGVVTVDDKVDPINKGVDID